MIRVKIYHEGRKGGTYELGEIRILRMDKDQDSPTGDYKIELSTLKGDEFAICNRGMAHFPRLRLNVMGLLSEALLQFMDNPEVFSLDAQGSSNVARKRGRRMFKISRGKS